MSTEYTRNKDKPHTLQQAINWLQSYYMRYPTFPLTGLPGNVEEFLQLLITKGREGNANRTGQSVSIDEITKTLRVSERDLKVLYLIAAKHFEKHSSKYTPVSHLPTFVDRLHRSEHYEVIEGYMNQGLAPTLDFIRSLPPYLLKDLATRLETYQEGKTNKRK